MEKAKRKAAERKADSRSGSANVPVIGCITITSEPCSLWVEVDPSSLGVGMDPTVFRRRPSDGFYQSGPAPAGCAGAAGRHRRPRVVVHDIVAGCMRTRSVARLVLKCLRKAPESGYMYGDERGPLQVSFLRSNAYVRIRVSSVKKRLG